MQKKNKFLSIFLCLALIMSIIPMGYISASAETLSFSGGDGSSETPYLIEDLEDLEELADFVNADMNNDCEGMYFKQTADITVENFEPIGRYEILDDEVNGTYYYFNGTYDGDSKEINGTIGAEGKNKQALFGVIWDNGTIKNVINNADVKGKDYVGGVVGINIGTITNCFNTGDVTGSENVGGILGYNYGIIENCYNTGTVKGESYVGGVVAYNFIGEIKNCYFNNEVYTTEDNTDGVTGKTTAYMSTQDFVDLLNGEDGTVFAFKDDVFAYYYPYLTAIGEDSAVVSKEKVKYEITEGDNQKVEIGTDGTLAFTSEGEFDKVKVLYLSDEIKKENLVADTNYTVVKGSTKITLNADYVKTLPLGAKTFTLKYIDGYSVSIWK